MPQIYVYWGYSTPLMTPINRLIRPYAWYTPYEPQTTICGVVILPTMKEEKQREEGCKKVVATIHNAPLLSSQCHFIRGNPHLLNNSYHFLWHKLYEICV